MCRLFPSDDYVDLIPLLKRMKKQTSNRPKKRFSRGPFMDYDRMELDRNGYKSHSFRGGSPLSPPIRYDLNKPFQIMQYIDLLSSRRRNSNSIISSLRTSRDGNPKIFISCSI